MSDKLGLEPAFPFFKENESGYGDTIVVYDQFGAKAFYPFEKGISKRFYAACAAMQGLCVGGASEKWIEATVKRAYQIADELLKQESEETA